MPDPWPTPWLKGHSLTCPACNGAGSVRGFRCAPCRGLGLISKPPAQIIAETVAENRAAS